MLRCARIDVCAVAAFAGNPGRQARPLPSVAADLRRAIRSATLLRFIVFRRCRRLVTLYVPPARSDSRNGRRYGVRASTKRHRPWRSSRSSRCARGGDTWGQACRASFHAPCHNWDPPHLCIVASPLQIITAAPVSLRGATATLSLACNPPHGSQARPEGAWRVRSRRRHTMHQSCMHPVAIGGCKREQHVA